MTGENECQEIRLAAMALADGESPRRDPRQIREHLENCESCRIIVSPEQQPLIPETARRARQLADFWPAIEGRLSQDRASLGANRAVRGTRRRVAWGVGLSTVACLLLVVASWLWTSFGRHDVRSTVETRVSPEASSTPPHYDASWDPPQHVDPEEFRKRFAIYFEPEFQQGQADRIGLNVNVESLRPVTIRAPDGPLGTLFIDAAGKVMLAVKSPLVSEFHEGLAVVGTVTDAKDGHRIKNYGFIDRTGKIVIAPEFDDASHFSEGLAAVHQGNQWGYINRQGQVVVPLRYRMGEPFRDSVACVVREDRTVQFINPTGEVLFTSNPYDVGRFSEGLLYVNLAGKQGIDRTVDQAVEIGRGRGYVDRKFEFVFRLGSDHSGFEPHRCEEFHDGMAAVEVAGSNQWGFMTREGKLTIPGPFREVRPFSEGAAAVTRENGPTPQWGYIDRAGKWLIEPRFLGAGKFAEELAPVLIPLDDKAAVGLPQSKWGYVDRTGRTVIAPRFYRAAPFEHGLACVSENPYHKGFIDKTGTYVFQFTEPTFGPIAKPNE